MVLSCYMPKFSVLYATNSLSKTIQACPVTKIVQCCHVTTTLSKQCNAVLSPTNAVMSACLTGDCCKSQANHDDHEETAEPHVRGDVPKANRGEGDDYKIE